MTKSLLVLFSLYCAGAFAQLASAAAEDRADAIRVADLEKVFWTCDYIATTRGVHAAPMALCSAVTDELKSVKFGGDFFEMLEWWRREKRARHERIAAEPPPTPGLPSLIVQ